MTRERLGEQFPSYDVDQDFKRDAGDAGAASPHVYMQNATSDLPRCSDALGDLVYRTALKDFVENFEYDRHYRHGDGSLLTKEKERCGEQVPSHDVYRDSNRDDDDQWLFGDCTNLVPDLDAEVLYVPVSGPLFC